MTQSPIISAKDWPRKLRNALRGASHRFLALDYDGTLAPFQKARMEAYPLPGVLDSLRGIVDNSSDIIAIVSGRSVTDIRNLTDNLPVTVFGSHGYERSDQPGTTVTLPLTPGQREGLDRAICAIGNAGFASMLEVKAASAAIHTRGVAEAESVLGICHTLLNPISQNFLLRLQEFNGGIEIRAGSINKGSAIRQMIAEMPDSTVTLYIGDDITDEDVFTVLSPPRGWGIKIGLTGATAAQFRMCDCSEVQTFLEMWRADFTKQKGRQP